MLSKFFESSFFNFLEKAVDVLILGLFWLVCSLPIITIGASSTALYYAIHKSVFQGRDYATKSFFSSFKDNFKQATLSWLPIMGIGIIAGYDLWLTGEMKKVGDSFGNMQIFFFILLCMLVIFALYVFMYMARFKNGFKDTLKIAGLLACLHFGYSIFFLLVFALFAVCAYALPGTILLIPGLFVVAIHPMSEKMFRSVMSEEDGKIEDQRNGIYNTKDE